ncbi:hypothetical protein HYH03_004803 [Edaphochlamys debaryana]|uniref:Uncharacterized protein n=1 Tax=Edaphochlamys debaryana TaxID=47281 RepID=A0A836C323_9CHLO|nr:hypothetical protein HYH03_004803 [Edaphochlamys debaryana]|eukprot:KAG2497214.1 hypothetical protein HYH03_004803 [Edaphochlamys debaryana]
MPYVSEEAWAAWSQKLKLVGATGQPAAQAASVRPEAAAQANPQPAHTTAGGSGQHLSPEGNHNEEPATDVAAAAAAAAAAAWEDVAPEPAEAAPAAFGEAPECGEGRLAPTSSVRACDTGLGTDAPPLLQPAASLGSPPTPRARGPPLQLGSFQERVPAATGIAVPSDAVGSRADGACVGTSPGVAARAAPAEEAQAGPAPTVRAGSEDSDDVPLARRVSNTGNAAATTTGRGGAPAARDAPGQRGQPHASVAAEAKRSVKATDSDEDVPLARRCSNTGAPAAPATAPAGIKPVSHNPDNNSVPGQPLRKPTPAAGEQERAQEEAHNRQNNASPCKAGRAGSSEGDEDVPLVQCRRARQPSSRPPPLALKTQGSSDVEEDVFGGAQAAEPAAEESLAKRRRLISLASNGPNAGRGPRANTADPGAPVPEAPSAQPPSPVRPPSPLPSPNPPAPERPRRRASSRERAPAPAAAAAPGAGAQTGGPRFKPAGAGGLPAPPKEGWSCGTQWATDVRDWLLARGGGKVYLSELKENGYAVPNALLDQAKCGALSFIQRYPHLLEMERTLFAHNLVGPRQPGHNPSPSPPAPEEQRGLERAGSRGRSRERASNTAWERGRDGYPTQDNRTRSSSRSRSRSRSRDRSRSHTRHRSSSRGRGRSRSRSAERRPAGGRMTADEYAHRVLVYLQTRFPRGAPLSELNRNGLACPDYLLGQNGKVAAFFKRYRNLWTISEDTPMTLTAYGSGHGRGADPR